MSKDNSGLFREKSLESIASPEQMNDYVKVIGPSIWIVLGAVIIFLAGIIVWGIFGRLESSSESVAFVNDGVAVCYVEEDTMLDIGGSSEIIIGGDALDIASVSSIPVQSSAVYNVGTLSDLGLSGYELVYPITARSSLPDGSYNASVVVERIHPMSFITGDKD